MKNKNITGYLYFYIHFITEVVCFYYLTKYTNIGLYSYVIPFIYDGFAFVPQSLFGYISDKYPKVPTGIIGIILLCLGIICLQTSLYFIIPLLCISLGNALIHVNGAEVTLRSSNGRLAPSAIFVAGGSFGVISGKLLANVSISPIILILVILTMIPFILLAQDYSNESNAHACQKFNYANKSIASKWIIWGMLFIVIARGFVGYGIPTSWNKTVYETILLYSFMGIGKALGGILADRFGIRKVGIYSTLLAIPFLCFGDQIMIVSLIGVMLFSMTMSITLAILVSVLPSNPGLAFGITTVGLYLGSMPIFFIQIVQFNMNCLLIIIISLLCAFILSKMIRKDE